MTRALPRTNFNSSRLIRFLADLDLVDAAEPGDAFAERLSLWLEVTDAISLSAANKAGSAGPSVAPAGEAEIARVAVAEEFARKREALVNSITRSCSPEGGEGRIKWPSPKVGMPIEVAAAYEPYRRFYVAHQRDMEANIRPLREKLRQALAQAAPALKKLAALDAVLDKVLSAREGQLLLTVPLLFEKRFAQLLAAHRQRLAAGGQEDKPETWMQAGGWLAGFCKELQALLLAELDVRLQPAAGLIEALSNEASRHK